MFDEPSEGIMAVLIKIEQNVEIALGLSDRAYILDQGEIVHDGRSRLADCGDTGKILLHLRSARQLDPWRSKTR